MSSACFLFYTFPWFPGSVTVLTSRLTAFLMGLCGGRWCFVGIIWVRVWNSNVFDNTICSVIQEYQIHTAE